MKQEGGFSSHGLLQYSLPVGFFQGTSGILRISSMLSAHILFFGSMSPIRHIQGRIMLTHTEIIDTYFILRFKCTCVRLYMSVYM